MPIQYLSNTSPTMPRVIAISGPIKPTGRVWPVPVKWSQGAAEGGDEAAREQQSELTNRCSTMFQVEPTPFNIRGQCHDDRPTPQPMRSLPVLSGANWVLTIFGSSVTVHTAKPMPCACTHSELNSQPVRYVDPIVTTCDYLSR